eukprot:jgi/Mesen1/6394/ME000329S05558
MSPHRMTASSMGIVEELLQLVQGIAALGAEVKSYKKSCWNLTRRIKLLAPLFEEIQDVNSPLPPSAVTSFQNLRLALQKAKSILEECRDGSRLYMIMERDMMAKKFQEITAKISMTLNGLPMELMAVSEEIQEQAQLVQTQLTRAKILEDAKEEQLQQDIRHLLDDDREGMADPGLLDPIVGKLGLTNLPALNKEIKALEIEKKKVVEQCGAADDIGQFISLLKRMRASLGGSEADAEAEVKVEKLTIAVHGSGIKNVVIPDDFKCPISLELMRDPVIVSTGQTYDRQYIEQWLKEGHKTCPKTQQVLTHPILIPNYSLRSIIAQWCETNGIELPKKHSRGHSRNGSSSPASGDLAGDRNLVLSLLQKLDSDIPDVQRAAAGDIRMLAKRSMGNRVCIAEAGVIPKLVMLLSSEDKKAQEHAVTALLNLSINDPNKGAIVAAGAIEPIVGVLRGGSMEARENAAATLFSLSVVDENKIVIGQSGAIPALVELLQEGTVRGKKDAATAIFNLSIYQGNKGRAVRAGVVPPLMDLLLERGTGMIDEALAILAILATSLDGRTAIGQANAVPILVDLLRTGSPRNKENAASVLLSLCLNATKHTQMAIDLGASGPLGIVLRQGTPRARRKASQMLQHLQEHEQFGHAGE